MSKQITRADLSKTFADCHKVEDAILAQLRERKIPDDYPSWAVLPALKQLSCPHWCASDAWVCMKESIGHWATAHGSLEVFRAARTMKPLPMQRFLEQRRKQAERTDEAKYLFADMVTMGDDNDG